MKAADIAEDLDEDLLRDIGGVGRVLQAADDQRIDGLVILGDQLRKRLLGAGLELGYKGCLFARDGQCARQMVHCCARLHSGYPLSYDVVNRVGKPLSCQGA